MTLAIGSSTVATNAVRAASIDPLAPARAGLIECEYVDKTAKTCMELATYAVRADGLYDLTSKRVLSQNPQIVWTYRSTAFTDADRICAKLITPDFDMMTFAIEGKEVGADQAMQMRNIMRVGWPTVNGKISCMKLVQTKTGLVSEYYVNGLIQIQAGRTPMKWVNPEEGYKLLGTK